MSFCENCGIEDTQEAVATRLRMRRLWDAVTKCTHEAAGCGITPAQLLRNMAGASSYSFQIRQWMYCIADALEPPKPAPPEVPPALCAECGKPITRALDEGACPGPEAWPETAGPLHPKCAEAFLFRNRGEHLKALLKVGDIVRMASKPRPITASGKALDSEAPQNQAPLFLAGKVGTVLWVCRDKPAVCVSFFGEKDACGWECHCGNLTRLVPDPAFKE